MVVKTYRGLLADGAQEKIPLSTKDGSVGYRITKFLLINEEPGSASAESVVKIYKTEQTTIDNNINFTDTDLLAAAYYTTNHAGQRGFTPIIFDTEIFNQDIYVTHEEVNDAEPCNYYIELEQMKLDHTQNMSATLKAIRGSAVD